MSELLTRICVLGKKRVNKVYDLTCGSGSLLLKPAKILGKENVEPVGNVNHLVQTHARLHLNFYNLVDDDCSKDNQADYRPLREEFSHL